MADQSDTATNASAARSVASPRDDGLLQLTGDFVRERIAQVLTEESIARIAHEHIRARIGVFTLKEAARWLKWKSPVALGRAMKREKIEFDTTDPKKTTIPFTELVRFRDIYKAKARNSKARIGGSGRRESKLRAVA